MVVATESSGGAGPVLEQEIRESERFRRREWRLERVGWSLLALFIVAGLLGVFGWGPLSTATALSEGGAIRAEYQWVGHFEADDSVTFVVSPDAVTNGTVTLELTGSWVGAVDVSSIAPAPSAEYSIPGGVALDFAVLGHAPVEVVIMFRAHGYWGLDALATVGDDSVGFSQFVLP